MMKQVWNMKKSLKLIPNLKCNARKHFTTSTTVTATDLLLQQNRKKLGYWFLGTGALVAGMVTVGGITRLTRSGLSMTSWKLQGSFPPTTIEEWEKEFARYKTFPEWQQRQSMTLSEFQYIYFWEYGHRMMGRLIGVAFVLPGIYFSVRGMIPKELYTRIFLLFNLGAGQGLIGWWMVKSGLENVDPNQKKEIRVSPYRLATHLALAFTTFTLLVKTGLNQFFPPERLVQMASHLSEEAVQIARKSRKFAIHNFALAAVTILTGAYVAGNDAGRAYNTFPKMGDDWIPPKEDLFPLEPLWRNFVETTGLVQFDHRIMAISTISAITVMYAKARTALQGQYWKQLPKLLRFGYNASMGMVALQVGLGITTLLLYVPVEVAAAHQAGSLILLTILTGLIHSLGFTKYGKFIANPHTAQKIAAAVTQTVAKN